MKVKVEFIEMIWDNYQGGSGKPITREMLIDIDSTTIIADIEGVIIDKLNNKGIRSNFNTKSFDYTAILSITILPQI